MKITEEYRQNFKTIANQTWVFFFRRVNPFDKSHWRKIRYRLPISQMIPNKALNVKLHKFSDFAYFYLKGRGRERERKRDRQTERKIFYQLVHYLNVQKGQSWMIQSQLLLPGLPHLCEGTRTWSLFYCLPRKQETGLEVEQP